MRDDHGGAARYSQLLADLREELGNDPFWSGVLARLATSERTCAVHLAIFVEPYLEYILEGKKTFESRFGVNRRPPYGRVEPGDVLLLKRSGGPVVGICEVKQVWFYSLDPSSWSQIKSEYSRGLCAQDPQFWKNRASASFATIMKIGEARRIAPLEMPKRDRRGWVLLGRATGNQGFLFP